MIDGLLIKRDELRKALRQVKKFSMARGADEAFLSFSDGHLRILVNDMRVGILAKGELDFNVSVSAVFLGNAFSVLPKIDPLLIQVVGNELFIGTLSISCNRVNAVPVFPPVEIPKAKTKGPSNLPRRSTQSEIIADAFSLPLNAPDRLILRMAQSSSPGQIVQGGLSGRLDKALMERNRRITQALKILEPYRVTNADLVRIISECVVREDG